MVPIRELIRFVELELGPGLSLETGQRSEGRFHYEGRAIFSADRLFGKEVRYALSAVWSETRPLLFGIGLNPSQARADRGDKTVNRVLDAAREEYGGLFWTNLGGQMETDSGTFVREGRQAGSRNSDQLNRVLNRLHPNEVTRRVLVGWGHRGPKLSRWREDTIIDRRVTLYTVGPLIDGKPPHPQRYPGDLQLIPLCQ